MERKFINVIYTEQQKEPDDRQPPKKQNKARLLIVLSAASVVLIAAGAISQQFYITLLGCAALLVLIWRLLLTPSIITSYDETITAITFSDMITIKEGKIPSQYEYSEINDVTEDENYFYLSVKANTVLRVRKDGFTLGTPDGFRAFINDNVKK